ncbi:uncharacterized protein UBRO_21011 [Ustilago bromivora]|uniref:Uncharacterized protein n=1 Tax=Ustilago bromivora TaxID=307758 RepID=A0A1K0G911_9BASI|nr:uncharacterized protein UBRO_21011 [Ustilago bromivora]
MPELACLLETIERLLEMVALPVVLVHFEHRRDPYMDYLVYLSVQERGAHVELSDMESVSMGEGKEYTHRLEANDRTEGLCHRVCAEDLKRASGVDDLIGCAVCINCEINRSKGF